MKKLIFAFIIMIFVILPISCVTQIIKTESKNKLTVEDIKSRYTGGENGEIINLTTFNDYYVLVECKYDTYSKGFDLYNMKTGDKDNLFRGAHSSKLEKIESENHFVFITDVPNNGNGHKYFPEIIKCFRYQEIPGSDEEFDYTYKELYLKVDQGVEMGLKSNESIADLKISLDGFEVLFGPEEGKEGEFYAAYTSIPSTKTSYDKANNQLIIEFENTSISRRIKTVYIDEENRYLSSVDVEKEGANMVLKVNLKDTAKYYNIKFSHLDPSIDDFPYLDFNFVSEFKMDE